MEISISHSHRQILTKLGGMIDADKVMNPQHFESDPAHTRIRIRINPVIWIRCLFKWLRDASCR